MCSILEGRKTFFQEADTVILWIVLAGSLVGGGIWLTQMWLTRTGRSARLLEREETSRVVRAGTLPRENRSSWVPRLQAYRRGNVVWGRWALAIAAVYTVNAITHLVGHDDGKAGLYCGSTVLFLALAYSANAQVRGTDKLLRGLTAGPRAQASW